MNTRLISSGSEFETAVGYSRAVVVEHPGFAEVFVSGCTGFDYATMSISEDVCDQARQCFVNIAKALAEAGGMLSHIVRVRYYLTDLSYGDIATPVFGEVLGKVRPAATALVCGRVDARMKLEIEVDARIPR